MTRTMIAAVLAALVSGCVIDAREKDYPIFDEPRRFQQVPNPAEVLYLRIPAGEVEIVQAPGPDLTAELIVRCAGPDTRCAEDLQDLDWQFEPYRDGHRLMLSKNRVSAIKNGELEVRIAVPVGHQVSVDITAGDVDVDLANCVDINMEAGDLRVQLPESSIRSIKVDTGTGDASLVRGGRTYGKRSLLIGAEALWQGGAGSCDNLIDLQAGDARVTLKRARSTIQGTSS